MIDKEKLRVIKHSLEETYKDSREYLDEFYEQCANDEFEDLEWIKDDKDFGHFLNFQKLEHNRIYDYALLELSRRLLKTINNE